jgi:hypothetical protein
MFRLTKSETQLVAFVLSVIVVGATVKHFREKQRELHKAPPAASQTAGEHHGD